MLRKILIPALLAATASTGAAEAARKCKVDLGPQLRVHVDLQIRLRSIYLPPPPYRIFDDLWVSKGGATSIMRTTASNCGDPRCDTPPIRHFVAGRSASNERQRLVDFFTGEQIGAEPFCLIANDYTQPTGIVSFGSMEVDWYGNPGAARHFTVVWGDADDFADLPACGDAERRLPMLLDNFELSTRGNGMQPLQCPLT